MASKDPTTAARASTFAVPQKRWMGRKAAGAEDPNGGRSSKDSDFWAALPAPSTCPVIPTQLDYPALPPTTKMLQVCSAEGSKAMEVSTFGR
jgi:hypothetical protein